MDEAGDGSLRSMRRGRRVGDEEVGPQVGRKLKLKTHGEIGTARARALSQGER